MRRFTMKTINSYTKLPSNRDETVFFYFSIPLINITCPRFNSCLHAPKVVRASGSSFPDMFF